MSELNDYRLEWGKLFRSVEYTKGTSEHAVREELMQTRPEIFPVQILRVQSQEELGGEAA